MILAVEPVRLVYEPRGAARQLWLSREPEVLIEGPAGTGKSRGILEKLLARADKYPRSRHLICRKTRASMTESILVTLEEKVLPPGSPIKSGPARMQRQAYHLPNGSSIVVGGLDNPERTFSTEYDTVVVFEATEASENDWESLQRALRNGQTPYHQAIADCNPGPPTHWLNQRAGTGRMQRLLSRHEDNPLFFQDIELTVAGRQYLSVLDNLSGHRKQRLRFGKWVSAEGAVYENYDAAVNLVDRFEVPSHWRRIRSIDFGYTNPFVCQWWAIDDDGRMYLYREIYRTKTLVEDHIPKIVQLSQGERFEATVADHDAEDRATAERHGIRTMPAYKAITPGIQAVASRISKAGDDKPRLFIFRDALVERDELLASSKRPVCTADEIDGYAYPKGQDGKPIKEEPAKVDDHGCDAMRYAVAYVDVQPVAIPVTGRVIFAGSR